MARGHEDFHRRIDINLFAPTIDLGELAVALDISLADLAVRLGITEEELADRLGLTTAELTTKLGWRFDELAARLGSPVIYDRGGKALFIDDFESGITKWQSYASGAGAAVEHSNEAAHSKTYSAKLTAGTTLSRAASITHRHVYRVRSHLGFEVSFQVNSFVEYVDFGFIFADDDNSCECSIRYDPVNEVVYYLGSDGDYHLLGASLYREDQIWSWGTMKITADAILNEFAHILFNEHTWDLTGTGGLLDLPGYPFFARMTVYVKGLNTGNGIAYIDDVIFSQENIRER